MNVEDNMIVVVQLLLHETKFFICVYSDSDLKIVTIGVTCVPSVAAILKTASNFCILFSFYTLL